MNIFLWVIAALLVALYLRRVSPVYVMRAFGARPFDQNTVLRNVKARMKAIAHRQRTPMPILWILPEFTPNALVLRPFGRKLYIGLTEGMVRALTAEELDVALSLCLSHGYQRGRSWQTWVGMFFYPVTRLSQGYPAAAQLLLAPVLSFFLRIGAGPGRFLRADREAGLKEGQMAVAAVLQKLSVLSAKIPLRNWNMALDSLFILSPLGLEKNPLWVFPAQPSVEERRSQLLQLP